MKDQDSMGISRRGLLQGSAGLALLTLMETPGWAQFLGASKGEVVIPFLDPWPKPPKEAIQQFGDLNKLVWENVGSWITPNNQFFNVSHYNRPVLRAEDWQLELRGLVGQPRTLTLDDLKARPRQEVVYTMECGGNNGFPWFVGGIGNARWAGTPLAPLLREAGIQPKGIEVVFFGSDEGEEEVRSIKMPQHFSRSLSIQDALDPQVLLCYEMNGQPLAPINGYPVRLILPGWYGVANVKWLTRIEIIDTHWAGRFMAKDYVTIRKELREDGTKVWTQKTVCRMRLKSMTAKVTVKDGQHRIYGMAWGGPVQSVEVRINKGPWVAATITQGQEQKFAWKFWRYDWKGAKPGDYTITARAIDTAGNIQPASDDPFIANKHTYWENNAQITRRVRIS